MPSSDVSPFCDGVSDADDVFVFAPESAGLDESVEFDDEVSSASAMPGLVASAPPMPSATANAPTRPMNFAYEVC